VALPDVITRTSGQAAGRSGRLPARVAFYLQASVVVSLLASSSAPTPLYPVYQAEWGFSPVTVTVVFGVYALAILAALLTVGSLSDHVGRRSVLLPAIVVQAANMVVFATAGGVPALLAARVVQGLATGAAVSALGAGMVDLDQAKGTIANSVAPLTGLALGGIGSGLLVQYLPAPTRVVYVVLGAIFVLQAIGIALMPEPSPPRPGALASLRPRFALPPAARRPLLAAAPALVAVWALGGFYGSLGPALVRLLSGSASLVLGGLAVFVLAAIGAVAVLVLRAAPPRTVMVLGVIALLAGVGVTVLAITAASAAVLFAGTAIAGTGFGAGFQGAIRTVLPLAAPHERAGVLAIMYVVSYLALGLPAVLAGLLMMHGAGLIPTARDYSAGVMVLAALALLGLARRPARRAPSPPASTPPRADPDVLARAGCPARDTAGGLAPSGH